jgi:hypothetical protein
MDEIERILRGLRETMTVMEALERRNANRLQDHQEWLESLQFAWTKHNAAWQRHEEVWQRHEETWQRHEEAWQRHQEWLVAHDRAMADLDVKMANLNELITRFIQGRNVN